MANDFILVLDFGGQQAQSMARKLRGQNYYCEVHPGDISPETVSRKAPRGLLLAGGSDGRPLNAELLRLGLPVLAMGACARAMAVALGAVSEGSLLTGRAPQANSLPCPLFAEGGRAPGRDRVSCGVHPAPEGFEPIATTTDGVVPAFANLPANLYGLQFYPNTDPDGAQISPISPDASADAARTWSSDSTSTADRMPAPERIGNGRAIHGHLRRRRFDGLALC